MSPQEEYEQAEALFRQEWSGRRGLCAFSDPDELREDLARLYERDREKDPTLRRLWEEAYGE